MRESIRRRTLFARSMLENPRTVGSVWPTSKWAVRDLLGMTDLPAARRVVEFGVGTGVYTGEIVERLGPDAEFLAFEVDPRLAKAVSGKLRDPRLRVLHESAENAERYLEGEKVDALVSSLPFTTFPAGLREEILDVSRSILAPGAPMLVLQYSKAVLPHLEKRFSRIRRRVSPLNVPPAFLYACENPVEPKS
ncbi:MAG: methyltransferase domain-containing protein [Rubrobacteraceae bacterium]